MEEIQIAVELITDEQFQKLQGIMSDLVLIVNRREELGGTFSERYIRELSKWTKKSEEFRKNLPQKQVEVICKKPLDYSQEKVYHELSLKRLKKEGIRP